MNKTMKIISVLLMVVILTAAFSTVCLADDTVIDPTKIGSGDYSGTAVATKDMQTLAGTIFKTIRNIAAILLVILIAILGVKFMMGSTEEKAEYKKSFIPLIVGTALVLAATTVAGFIWTTFGGTTIEPEEPEEHSDIVTVAKL